MNSRRLSHLDIAVRASVDLLIAQISMLLALLAPMLHARLSFVTFSVLRNYYLTIFLPLSLLFPSVYAINGLYSPTWRGTNIPIRLRRATLAAVLGVLAFLIFSTALLPSRALPPRSSIVAFVFLVVLGTPGIRWVKNWAFDRDSNDHRRHLSEHPTPETVLVAGGAGYIGSIVARKLLDRGYRVRLLDNLTYGSSAIEEILSHSRFKLVRGDCRNIQDVVRAMTGVGAVVHLAAIVGDPACERDHQTAREINFAATRMMIEIAKGHSVKRFVFASSCSVYGVSRELMTEDSQLHPLSLYAETKVDSEEELLTAATEAFQPTILRFSTIFGLSPRPRFDLVVNLLTAKALRDNIITIFNGDQWRPFLHVADAAESIVRVLEAPIKLVGGQIYNVGDERLNCSLAALAQKILRVLPNTRIEHVQNADGRDYRVSFQKISADLGFFCSKTLEDGIRELIVAFENGLIRDYRLPLYNNAKYLETHGSPAIDDEIGAQVMAALAQRRGVLELAKAATVSGD